MLLPGTDSVLLTLNHTTPIFLVTYFIASTIAVHCKSQLDKLKPISRRREICLVLLSFFITLSYFTRMVRQLSCITSTTDDALIHSIVQSLLWISLSLILTETSLRSVWIWSGTSILNFVLEVIISACTFSQDSRKGAPDTESFLNPYATFQLCSLAGFTTLSILLLHDDGQTTREGETQSLLNTPSGKRNIASSTPMEYSTLQAANNDEDDNSECETASDSDDDETMLKLQQERFQSSGGWIGYLKAFKIFVPYVFPKKNTKLQIYLIVMLINILFQRVLHILRPRQLGMIIDHLWVRGHIPWKDIFLWNLFAIVSSNSCGIGAVNEMLENRLFVRSRRELTYASLDHVMSLSMDFHDQKDSGEVIKAIEQAQCLNELLRILVLDLLPAGLDVAISLWYVMYLLDVYATFIVLAMIIAFAYATYKISVLATVARRVSSQKERDESKLVYESVGNWFAISCFDQKDHTMARLSRVLNQRFDAGLWNDDLYTYIFCLQEFSEQLGRLGVTILAAHRIVTGRSTVGDLVILQSYWETFTWPLYSLSRDYRRMNSALVDAERLLQLFQAQPSVKDTPSAQKCGRITGLVSLRDVTFAYEDRSPTLHGITLTAHPGQTIAFVGETGSGKSTLFKLLMRFYDVSTGSISIDSQNITDITLPSLRRIFGFVPQDPVLFNMSILENVRYARLDATDAQVHEACKAASIHDKILSLPRGYLSQVGERGVKLSGGERQRMAIARVFLKDAAIVLLDEATSAMDSQTEARIQESLRVLTREKTTFVIAHRLSTVVEADKICVVGEGRIVEEGRHGQLLEKKGKYWELWAKQAMIAT